MRRAWFAAIVLILGVAGCTSDGDPAPSSPAGSSTSTLPSTTVAPSTPTAAPSPAVATTGPNVRPGEKPPVLPAAGRTNTRAGAVLFATYWFKALDWGYATTDSTLAKSLYLPQCTDCARFMKNFDDTKAKRQHFRGGRLALASQMIVSGDTRHPGSVPVEVVFDAGRLSTVDAEGKTLGSDPPQRALRYRVWLAWRAANWRLQDFKQVVT